MSISVRAITSTRKSLRANVVIDDDGVISDHHWSQVSLVREGNRAFSEWIEKWEWGSDHSWTLKFCREVRHRTEEAREMKETKIQAEWRFTVIFVPLTICELPLSSTFEIWLSACQWFDKEVIWFSSWIELNNFDSDHDPTWQRPWPNFDDFRYALSLSESNHRQKSRI
jgi:hypothetical protein